MATFQSNQVTQYVCCKTVHVGKRYNTNERSLTILAVCMLQDCTRGKTLQCQWEKFDHTCLDCDRYYQSCFMWNCFSNEFVTEWLMDSQSLPCPYVQGLLDTRVILLNRNITVRPNLIWCGNRRRASSLLWACCMPVFGKGTGSLKQLWLMVHMAGMLLRCFPVTSTDRTIYQNWPIEALHVEFYLQERFPPCTCSQWTLPAHRKTCYSGSQTTNPVSHINHKIKTKAVW